MSNFDLKNVKVKGDAIASFLNNFKEYQVMVEEQTMSARQSYPVVGIEVDDEGKKVKLKYYTGKTFN